MRGLTARVKSVLRATILLAAGAGAASEAAAQVEAHPTARQATVEERPGAALPLDARLIDEDGRAVRLGRFFEAGRPVLLVPGYYECHMLCPLVLGGLRRSLDGADGWRAGRDLTVVGVSIDPSEGPDQARARREEIDAGEGWHLLVADEAQIRRITEAIGFGFARDDETDQFAHAAVAVAATPDGRVGRYVYGLDVPPDTLGAALASARDGRAVASLEQVLVRCFRFSPTLQRYAGHLAWFLRLGGLAIVAGLGAVFALAGHRALKEETP